MSAGRIAGSDITAKDQSAQNKKPFRNNRPDFEGIMNSSLDRNSAPAKLRYELDDLEKNSKAKGVEDKVNSVLKIYATEINNDIILLWLRRLNNMVKNSDGETLTKRL